MLHAPPDCVSLASGYGSFLTPPAAAVAAVRAIQAGQLPLLDAASLPALRQALAGRYQEQGARHITSENVVVTPGARAALFALFKAILRPGDEVVLLTPNWFGMWEMVEEAGGIVRELLLSPDDNYELDPEHLRATLTPQTRLLLFTNPNNPTGRVYYRDEIASLLSVTQEFPDLFVLSDEIYNLIHFGHQPVPSLLDFPDPHGRHLVVNGFSKSLALIGWRVGYLVAPPEVARTCTAWQRITIGAVPAPTQYAALEVTLAAASISSELISQLYSGRVLMLQQLAALPQVPAVQPEATYYAFPDLRAYLSPNVPPVEASRALVTRLRTAGVEVVDGTSCGAPGFVRISYAVPKQIVEEALNRLALGLRLPGV